MLHGLPWGRWRWIASLEPRESGANELAGSHHAARVKTRSLCTLHTDDMTRTVWHVWMKTFDAECLAIGKCIWIKLLSITFHDQRCCLVIGTVVAHLHEAWWHKCVASSRAAVVCVRSYHVRLILNIRLISEKKIDVLISIIILRINFRKKIDVLISCNYYYCCVFLLFVKQNEKMDMRIHLCMIHSMMLHTITII